MSEEEIIDLKWTGLESKPATGNENDLDTWRLQLASIQVSVNLHDWRHRISCFKKTGDHCRYNLPDYPAQNTIVNPVYRDNDRTGVDALHVEGVTGVAYSLRRRAPCGLFTECNIPLLSVLNYNNCTRYVRDQKVSMYIASYVTKHSTEKEKELSDLVHALKAYVTKVGLQQHVFDSVIDKQVFKKIKELKNEFVN